MDNILGVLWSTLLLDETALETQNIREDPYEYLGSDTDTELFSSSLISLHWVTKTTVIIDGSWHCSVCVENLISFGIMSFNQI